MSQFQGTLFKEMIYNKFHSNNFLRLVTKYITAQMNIVIDAPMIHMACITSYTEKVLYVSNISCLYLNAV